MKLVRTRFAPSPTGALHIGGARTALFNYLLAKKEQGKFILRIEDTDIDRNMNSIDVDHEKTLKHLQLFPDESFNIPGNYGPYKQSQKIDEYKKIAKELIKQKKAYYCFCSSSELEEEREKAYKNNSTPIYSQKCRHLSCEEIHQKLEQNIPYTIRLKVDLKQTYSWEDLIRGKIAVAANSLSDCIIIRTNGIATYNFAVVIDDLRMEISHILRGEEHITNTAYQLAIYESLQATDRMPKFAHISLILNQDKQKMSKRDSLNNYSVNYYLEKGYYPQALVNFLVLLGWSYKEQEIFSLDELFELFDIKNISVAPAIFDLNKLNWINHKYFQNMEDQYYLNFVNPFFNIDLGKHNDKKSNFALIQKNRIFYANELNDLSKEYFEEKYLTESMMQILKNNKDLINLALTNFPTYEEWNILNIRNYLKRLKEISNLQGAALFKPLRIALNKQEEGLDIPNMLLLHGKEESWTNLVSISKIIQ